jgi:hypothetical protein
MTQVTRSDHRVIMDTLSALDCARSLTVAILLRYEHYSEIVNLSFNPYDYNSMIDARDSLQATELLRKHEDLPTNIDKEQVALSAFILAENVCKQTNERLIGSNSHVPQRFAAARKISLTLGSFIPADMIEFAGWGPGVTLTLRGKDATPFNKFDRKAECTKPLLNLLKPWWDSQFPIWPLSANEYEGNRVITVPKNAKTDRTIAVEPSLNLFFQKGIGTMIRNALQTQGIDLNDQTRNQDLSKEGSVTNLLTTVDFSAASDTISWMVVQDLLPDFWFKVMDLLRSPRGYLRITNELIEYEKFSSMGNGFTFELESLIFWALAYACTPDDHPLKSKISVYGDDVIIPTDCYDRFIDLCTYLGFSVNKSKSFSSSYYRESCGKHFWAGVDISPVYLRRSLSSIGEKMMFHNRLVEYSIRCIGEGFRDKRFRSVISFLASSSEVKNSVPLGMGDLGLTKSFDECCPIRNRRYQRGYNVKIRSFRAKKSINDGSSILILRLYELSKHKSIRGVGIAFGNECVVPRSGRYCFTTIYYPEWPCLGPWV